LFEDEDDGRKELLDEEVEEGKEEAEEVELS
jgi:hypothetical protein